MSSPAPTDFADLKAYLTTKVASFGGGTTGSNGTQKSALELPPDGGKTPTTGERSSENSADVRKSNPEGNVESAKAQTEDGSSKKVLPDSGLEQTIAGQEDSQTRAVKKITDENEKIAKIDLDSPDGFDRAFAAIDAAQVAMKAAIARETRPAGSSTKLAGIQTNGKPFDAKQAAEQAVYNTTATYIKLGSDRADLTASYLDGFTQTMSFLQKAADDGTLAAMLAGGGGGGAPGGAPPGPGGPGGGGDPAAAMAAMQAGAGGSGGDAGGGDSGGAPSPDDVAGGMNEMNLSPEQIQEIISILQDQLGQASPAPSPDEKAAAEYALSVAKSVVKSASDHMRSGKYQYKPAADGTPARKGRDVAKKYLGELVSAGAR